MEASIALGCGGKGLCLRVVGERPGSLAGMMLFRLCGARWFQQLASGWRVE
jgi:hypothetical protein